MQIHEIKPKYKKKDRKRVGRGGKRGTYAGRGVKGQKARAGGGKEPIIRGVIKRYPKLRGYNFRIKKAAGTIVNLSSLEKGFKDNEVVSPQSLIEKGIIRKIKGQVPRVKILAEGDLKKKLLIKDCFVSKQARKKIEEAGGQIREGAKGGEKNVKQKRRAKNVKQESGEKNVKQKQKAKGKKKELESGKRKAKSVREGRKAEDAKQESGSANPKI